MKENITPGALVNRELGTAAIAESLSLQRSTVWRWAQKRPRGTGGLVPAEYHRDLMSLAHRLGKSLSANDLIFGRHE